MKVPEPTWFTVYDRWRITVTGLLDHCCTGPLFYWTFLVALVMMLDGWLVRFRCQNHLVRFQEKVIVWVK